MHYSCLLQFAGDCGYTASAIFKYFREHTAPHLFRGLRAHESQIASPSLPQCRKVAVAMVEAACGGTLGIRRRGNQSRNLRSRASSVLPCFVMLN